MNSESSGLGEASSSARRTVILHVLPQSLNRGAQVYAGNLRDALHSVATQEHLIVTLFAGPKGRVRPDVELGVNVGFPRRLLDPRAAWALRRLVRRLGADVTVAHGGEALKYTVVAGGAEVIYKRTGLSTNEISRFGRALLYGFLSRRARWVVGVSHDLLNQAHDLFRVPKERLVYIPNSRDPDVYHPETFIGVPPPRSRILFVGQFEVGKRPALFLDTVEYLRDRKLDFDAAMVGDGHLREGLSQRASDLHVELLGIRNDLPELIRQSAVVVMTSAPGTEGMPGVLIEAGLSGVPVVATKAAGVADVIEHGVTGYVVDEANPGALGDYVARLLKSPEVRSSLGKAARTRCLQLFSIETTAKQWRDLIVRTTRPVVTGGGTPFGGEEFVDESE